MLKFFRITLVILFTIITIGCGNANLHEQPTKKASIPVIGSRDGGIVAGDVIPQLSVELEDKHVILHYSLNNQTEHPVTYTFPTSQRYDYIITSKNGDIVKKYSEGKMFAQFVSTITIKQGESLTFTDVVDDLPKGSYVVTFWITAKEDQFKTTTSFKIE